VTPGGGTSYPPGFDRKAFLDGATRAYRILQEAWDQGDLAELRGLTSDDVFAELQDQIKARRAENRTEVLELKAEVVEVRQVGAALEASVLFEAYLREVGEPGADAETGQPVQEVWHFIQPAHGRGPSWLLEGIQQVD
jgi:predicted lipid-binding transport protein (Tim44 family)